jgi:YfiH family protein
MKVMEFVGEFDWLTVEQWRSIPRIVHGFGTRNMTEDQLIIMKKTKGFTPVQLRQIHSDTIHSLESVPDGQLTGDALVTDRPGLLLLIKTADCLPVLILSQRPKAVAAAHCGWRGTQAGLVAKIVRKMVRLYGCTTSTLQVAFGPSISQDCYEVGEDVRRSFVLAGQSSSVFKAHPIRKNKYLFDLREANRLQFLSCGIKRERIHSLCCCTHCDARFYSYRRKKKESGRMINFIGLLS